MFSLLAHAFTHLSFAPRLFTSTSTPLTRASQALHTAGELTRISEERLQLKVAVEKLRLAAEGGTAMGAEAVARTHVYQQCAHELVAARAEVGMREKRGREKMGGVE
jgi:hypothetical protein